MTSCLASGARGFGVVRMLDVLQQQRLERELDGGYNRSPLADELVLVGRYALQRSSYSQCFLL